MTRANLFILFLFSINSIASSTGDGKTIIEKDDDKKNTHQTLIKEKQVEKFIVGSQHFKTCKDQFDGLNGIQRKDKIKECFKEKLDSFSEEQISALSDGLGLEQFGITQNNETNEIKTFISKRLNKALYGVEDPNGKKLSELKHVSHDTFNKLHHSNLTKSFYRDTFDYCMNYVHIKTALSTATVEPCECRAANLSDSACATAKNYINKVWKENSPDSVMEKLKLLAKGDSVPGTPLKSYLSDMTALRGCIEVREKKATDPDISEKITAPAYENSKFQLCLASAPIFCEAYEKKTEELKNMINATDITAYDNKYISGINKSTNNHLMDIEEKNCQDSSGADIDCEEKHYAKSCLIVKKMKNYRKAIAATEENAKRWKELGSKKGYSKRHLGNGLYTGKGEGEKIDDLTTITSQQIKDNYKDNDLLENKKKCEDSRDKDACAKFYGKMDKKNYEDLIIAHDARTELMKAKIGKMADKDQLKEFAKNSGYHQILKEIEDETDAKVQDLKDKLNIKYELERQALIQEFNAKLKETHVITREDNTQIVDENKIRDNTVKDTDKKKEKLERLYHYSNIVMGYIEVGEGADKQQFSSIRDAELNQSNADDTAYQDSIRDADRDTGSGRTSSSDNSNSMITLSSDVIDRYLKGGEDDD
jgi:hypothetical protein